MSKCRAKDPRKCYYHAAVGQFVQRVARIKTRATDEEIKQTLSELNKEGSKLPAPSEKDVNNWIDGKVLATEYDPDLSDEEREIQMKYLEQAREDVKAGVAGGRFHAWKNLVNRLKDKGGKRIAAVTMIGALTFGVAGCVGVDKDDTTTPSPTGSSTSQPTTAPDGSISYGDVVVLGDVTDSYGTYQQTTVSPDDDSMKLDKSVIDQSAYDAGFSDEEILSAQQWTVKFATEEVADSKALDNGAAWDAWKQENKGRFLTSQQYILDAAGQNGNDRPAVINNNPTNSGVATNPVFTRDGKPRINNSTIKVTKVVGGTQEGIGSYLEFELSGTTSYRVDDAAALDYLKARSQETNATSALKDNTGTNLWNVDYSLYYGIAKEGGDWKIGGYTNNFDSNPGSGWVNQG